MDLVDRIMKIAEMESIPISKFDIAGTREFLKNLDGKEIVSSTIQLEYDNDNLWNGYISSPYRDPAQKIDGMIPEVSNDHEFYNSDW